MQQECPICYEITCCNILLGCNHAICDACKTQIKLIPGKTTLIDGAPCIQCPFCRKTEWPPYHHILSLLHDSRVREIKYIERITEQTNQLLTAELTYQQLRHRFKLKIRRETTVAPVAALKTSEPCDTCLKKTPRRCNVYGCRKHCCMSCVICKECEQCIINQRHTNYTVIIVD